MTIRDVLIYLDSSPRSRRLMTFALALARSHSARVTGLHVIQAPSPVLFYSDPPAVGSVRFIEQMVANLHAQNRTLAARLEQEFRENTKRAAVEAVWRIVEGYPTEAVALYARHADLTILRQQDPEDASLASIADIARAVRLSGGRPILVLPHTGRYSSSGRRVLVHWQNTLQLRRAMPLLRQADEVTVLTIVRDARNANDDIPARDIALHLARHGVNASAARAISNDSVAGLLNFAHEFEADLIVAGDYPHSRIREFIFGSMMRTLLTRMTVPVCFSD